MMPVTLMRHAEADWALVNGLQLPGAANDLAPLTVIGRQQARAAAQHVTADLVVSSPMTRALETAAIIATEHRVELRVVFDLREWLPDETYSWTSPQQVEASYQDMRLHGGVRPDDHDLRWERLVDVRQRVSVALAPWVDAPEAVLAVSHEVVIFAMTGQERTAPCATQPVLIKSAH